MIDPLTFKKHTNFVLPLQLCPHSTSTLPYQQLAARTGLHRIISVYFELPNCPAMLLKLVLILSIAQLMQLASAVPASKTIVEGQGLWFCEDANSNCIISIETEDGRTWTPSDVPGNDKDLILEPELNCSCGLRLLNISRSFDKNTIKFGLREILVEYRINVIPFNEIPTTTLFVPYGQRIAAGCEFPATLEILRCRMHLKSKSQTLKWCHKRYYSENETIECWANVKGSADPIHSKVKVIVEPQQVHQKKEPHNSFYRCKTPLGAAESCIAENFATKEAVNLEDNLRGHQFSSRLTKLDDGVCELQIVSDVASYVGPWKIFMKMKSLNSSYYAYDGCLFNAADDYEGKVIQDFIDEVATPKHLPYHPNLTITCPPAPYPLTRCYLLSGNELIFPSPDLFQRSSKLGICMFRDVKIVRSNELVCSFNSHDPTKADLQQRYIVEEEHMNLITVSKPIIRRSSTNSSLVDLELSCKFSMEIAFTNCLFVSPHGQLYHLPTSAFSGTNYSYKGKGLANGECGAVITVDEKQLAGRWSCHIEAFSFYKKEVIEVGNSTLS